MLCPRRGKLRRYGHALIHIRFALLERAPGQAHLPDSWKDAGRCKQDRSASIKDVTGALGYPRHAGKNMRQATGRWHQAQETTS